jgi:hypothetical protein
VVGGHVIRAGRRSTTASLDRGAKAYARTQTTESSAELRVSRFDWCGLSTRSGESQEANGLGLEHRLDREAGIGRERSDQSVARAGPVVHLDQEDFRRVLALEHPADHETSASYIS